MAPIFSPISSSLGSDSSAGSSRPRYYSPPRFPGADAVFREMYPGEARGDPDIRHSDTCAPSAWPMFSKTNFVYKAWAMAEEFIPQQAHVPKMQNTQLATPSVPQFQNLVMAKQTEQPSPSPFPPRAQRPLKAVEFVPEGMELTDFVLYDGMTKFRLICSHKNRVCRVEADYIDGTACTYQRVNNMTARYGYDGRDYDSVRAWGESLAKKIIPGSASTTFNQQRSVAYHGKSEHRRDDNDWKLVWKRVTGRPMAPRPDADDWPWEFAQDKTDEEKRIYRESRETQQYSTQKKAGPSHGRNNSKAKLNACASAWSWSSRI